MHPFKVQTFTAGDLLEASVHTTSRVGEWVEPCLRAPTKRSPRTLHNSVLTCYPEVCITHTRELFLHYIFGLWSIIKPFQYARTVYKEMVCVSFPGCFKSSVCVLLYSLDPPPLNPSVQFRCFVNNLLPSKNAWAKWTCVRAWAPISDRMHSNT